MSESLWAWSTGIASGDAGLRLAWTWAFLEAIILPLPPELLLIPLALAAPDRAAMLAASGVVGSLMGGSVSYLLGRYLGERVVSILRRLPGVSSEQVLWASAMLRRLDMTFVAVSPWLVLPYKITSVLSGHLRVRWWRYGLAGLIGRGTRLIGIAVTVGLLAGKLQPLIRSWYVAAVLLAYVSVATVLWPVRRNLLLRVMSQ